MRILNQKKMKNIPKKIYLQLGFDVDEWPSLDFNKCSEVTWCEDRQHESDIEYVLVKDVESASQSPELINEILTKYMEWAYDLPAEQFADWEDEEGDREKTKARIRKEFIEYINNKIC